MFTEEKWKILDSARCADESLYQAHMIAFTKSFVERSRRDRWLYLLQNRPKNIYQNSHKLYDVLNQELCQPVTQIKLAIPMVEGVYYDFWDQPLRLDWEKALALGEGKDGIFSLIPGKLAFYFYHEGEILVCRK